MTEKQVFNFPLESQTVEFKQVWKDEYLKTICAFANSDGGSFYIGVEDDGSIVGIKSVKSLLEVAGFVESWGKGTNNIVDDCLKMELPEPEYRYAFGAVQVSLYKTTPKTTSKTTKERLIGFIVEDNFISREVLANKLGIGINGV